jgi:enoyl-CoA hydratase/carnithine racemase
MTDAPPLLVTEEDAILIATLNRPDKYNAINQEMMQLLEEAVLRFRDTRSLKVMLIRATGKYFSAGADIKQGSGSGPPEAYTAGSQIREMHRLMPSGMRRVWDEMEGIEKPFVVAHQGPCVGGGLEMSLSCDFRLASTRTHYSFPEGLFGVLPATNGVSRLTRVVGPHWARYLVMGNLKADAQKALYMGLVHEVFPEETFEEDVMNFARHIAKQHGEQMGVAKIAIELAADLGVTQAAAVERFANGSLMMMPDYLDIMKSHREGVGGKKE